MTTDVTDLIQGYSDWIVQEYWNDRLSYYINIMFHQLHGSSILSITLVRVRATVAHDSYERLVEVPCAPGEHKAHAVRSGLYRLPDVIENASYLASA
jgi:hypothetical protein